MRRLAVLGLILVVSTACEERVFTRPVECHLLDRCPPTYEGPYPAGSFEIEDQLGLVQLGYESFDFWDCATGEGWSIDQTIASGAEGYDALRRIWQAELVSEGYEPNERWFSHAPVAARVTGSVTEWQDRTYGHMGWAAREIAVVRFAEVATAPCTPDSIGGTP